MSLTETAIHTFIAALTANRTLPDDGFTALIDNVEDCENELFAQADVIRRAQYGNAVYIRGLIEFTNICKNNCLYCGIRACNPHIKRYRLTQDEILACCAQGYALGFRTFVLQGGEDPYFNDDMVCAIVSSIKTKYPDCAVTLSIGEKPYASYKAFFEAGADRYLLRHETANAEHYASLHTGCSEAASERRKACLWDLKNIGYQVGAGFMVGAPFQKTAYLIEDLRFLEQLQPDMIGIGPFIPHADTVFADQPAGDWRVCLRLIALLRLMFPYALIPATTALATAHPQGRIMGLKAGANVVMPNLSPLRTRKLYALYDHKAGTGEEAAESVEMLRNSVEAAGYTVVTHIGHVKHFI